MVTQDCYQLKTGCSSVPFGSQRKCFLFLALYLTFELHTELKLKILFKKVWKVGKKEENTLRALEIKAFFLWICFHVLSFSILEWMFNYIITKAEDIIAYPYLQVPLSCKGFLIQPHLHACSLVAHIWCYGTKLTVSVLNSEAFSCLLHKAAVLNQTSWCPYIL